jgi:hypothetical protein
VVFLVLAVLLLVVPEKLFVLTELLSETEKTIHASDNLD